MIALLATLGFLLLLGSLFLLLGYFHITVALMIFGGISLLFIVSARKQVEKAKAFRKAWLQMKAQKIAQDDAWKSVWRKFLINTGMFLAAWAGCVTFIGIYVAMFLSVKAGGSSGLLLLIFLPGIVVYSVATAAASAVFGCLFAYLWVKTSPVVALTATSAPLIVVASMAITMIIHLNG